MIHPNHCFKIIKHNQYMKILPEIIMSENTLLCMDILPVNINKKRNKKGNLLNLCT